MVLPLCGLIIIQPMLIKTLYLAFLLIYYAKHEVKILMIISIYFMAITCMPSSSRPFNEGSVISIKEHYIIVKNKRQKVLVKNAGVVHFDDWIQFDGTHQKISQPSSRYQFNFMKYMAHSGVNDEIKATSIKVIKPSKSIRGRIQRTLEHHPDAMLLSKVLFNINHEELNLSDLLYSSGTTIRMAIYLLTSLLSIFFYEKEVFCLRVVLILLSFQIHRDFFMMLRLLLMLLFRQTKLNRSTQSACCFLIMIILNYHLLFQQGFIIYFLITFIGSVYTERSKILIPAVIIPMQLFYQFKVNLWELIIFRYISFMNALLFLSGLCDGVFKSRFCYYLFKIRSLIPTVPINITGHLSIVGLLIWIYLLMKYLSTHKNICLMGLFLLLLINQNQALFNPMLSLTQLYVGQGDAAVIQMPFKREVLFLDVGPASGYKKLEGYMNYYGIRNYRAIISHADEDHCGALDHLQSNFREKELLDVHFDQYDYHNLQFLQLNKPVYDNDNDNSLVLLFKINQYQFLYTGDIGSVVEKDILMKYDNLNYNVLKLAHHGSKHSNSMEILKNQNLKLIINSSGARNLYHHPSPQVLQRIMKVGVPLLDTQDVGDISFLFFKRISLIKLEV